jgi:hypothetical protein
MGECKMNKSELMDRAVNQYSGVWPSEGSLGDERLALCVNTYTESGETSREGEIHLVVDSATDKWSIFCTKNEFESYVAESKE